MKKISFLSLLAIALISLSACGTKQEQPQAQTPNVPLEEQNEATDMPATTETQDPAAAPGMDATMPEGSTGTGTEAPITDTQVPGTEGTPIAEPSTDPSGTQAPTTEQAPVTENPATQPQTEPMQ